MNENQLLMQTPERETPSFLTALLRGLGLMDSPSIKADTIQQQQGNGWLQEMFYRKPTQYNVPIGIRG